MKTIYAWWFALLCLLPLPIAAQAPGVITMDQEPHHHLSLQNDFVKIFKVEVAPGDSIILHRHDQDTVAIAIGEQLVTIGVPGKPDVHQKNADAQVRLQRGGYVHSTRVDGTTAYHTVAVELLRPQTNFRNLCAEILPGVPQECPAPPVRDTTGHSELPLLRSDQTYVRLMSAAPHESLDLAKPGALAPSAITRAASRVIVALDAASISSQTPDGLGQNLQPGDFVWIDGAPGHGWVYRNKGEKVARFIEIIFPQVP